MLKKTRIKVMDGNKLINTYSGRDDGYSSWSNPFEFIPDIGDTLVLTNGSEEPFKCQVIARELHATAKYVGNYGNQEVILNVIECE